KTWEVFDTSRRFASRRKYNTNLYVEGRQRFNLERGCASEGGVGYVQNRTRPEGCIAERWSAFKPKDGSFKAIIRQHMIHIKIAHPKFRKRTKWLQDKHNSTFIQWLRFKVQSELEEDNHGVSENLRWLAAGPNMAVPLYRSYLIKGIKFNIKAQDDVRTTQNSGVYLLAHTMQVASAKDKNPILSNMGFYGVIQEIWDLDYQFVLASQQYFLLTTRCIVVGR
ncbi:hypothetical protein Prudu_1073S000900, partial [Prunus dulcis]